MNVWNLTLQPNLINDLHCGKQDIMLGMLLKPLNQVQRYMYNQNFVCITVMYDVWAPFRLFFLFVRVVGRLLQLKYDSRKRIESFAYIDTTYCSNKTSDTRGLSYDTNESWVETNVVYYPIHEAFHIVNISLRSIEIYFVFIYMQICSDTSYESGLICLEDRECLWNILFWISRGISHLISICFCNRIYITCMIIRKG